MTKTLEFKNLELAPIANALGTFRLKGMASRGRSKLIKLLSAKNDEYNSDMQELQDPYILKDKDGKNVPGDQPNTFKLVEDKDKRKELIEERQKLNEEKAIIEFTEYSNKFKALYDELKNYNYELSDQVAVSYDLLMDQLEKNYEKEGK